MTYNFSKSLESEINSIIDWPIKQLTIEGINSFDKYESVFNECLGVLIGAKDNWEKLSEKDKNEFLEEFREVESKLRRIFDYYSSAFRIRNRKVLANILLNSDEQTKLLEWVENKILTSNKFQAIYFEDSEEIISNFSITSIQQNMPGVLHIKGISKKETFYKLVSRYVYQILLETLVSSPRTRECPVSTYFYKKIIGKRLCVKFDDNPNLASALTGIFFEKVSTDEFLRGKKDSSFRVTLIKGIEGELCSLGVPLLSTSSESVIKEYLEPAAIGYASFIDFFAEKSRKRLNFTSKPC